MDAIAAADDDDAVIVLRARAHMSARASGKAAHDYVHLKRSECCCRSLCLCVCVCAWYPIPKSERNTHVHTATAGVHWPRNRALASVRRAYQADVDDTMYIMLQIKCERHGWLHYK